MKFQISQHNEQWTPTLKLSWAAVSWTKINCRLQLRINIVHGNIGWHGFSPVGLGSVRVTFWRHASCLHLYNFPTYTSSMPYCLVVYRYFRHSLLSAFNYFIISIGFDSDLFISVVVCGIMWIKLKIVPNIIRFNDVSYEKGLRDRWHRHDYL